MTQHEINLEVQSFYVKAKYFLAGFGMAIVILLFLNKCGRETPAVAKEVKGTFRTNTVINTPIYHIPDVGKTINRLQNENVPINQELARNNTLFFEHQIDSLLKINEQNERIFVEQFTTDSLKLDAYQKAIQLNEFSKEFEDNNIKANISGIAQGTVNTLLFDYELKKQPTKERVFALKYGVEYGNTTALNNGIVKANLGLDFKKFTIRYGYDTSNRHFVGFEKTLFDIKR